MTATVPFKTPDDYLAERPLLVAVDSDGSALDTMDVKYRQCFIPAVIDHFELGVVAAAATQVAEFVFLNSQSRGLDRFRALARILDLVADHPDIRAAAFKPPALAVYRAWLDQADTINEPALAQAAAQADSNDGDELDQVLRWSRAIDAATQARVGDTPPFEGVREALARAAGVADVVVISSAPTRVVQAEWRTQAIDSGVRLICGLEFGPKAQLLGTFMAHHYGIGKVMMIGDSPGDRRAAQTSGARFYPIIPAREQRSWQRFDAEILDLFSSGRYSNELENRLSAEFDAALSTAPPWQASPGEIA